MTQTTVQRSRCCFGPTLYTCCTRNWAAELLCEPSERCARGECLVTRFQTLQLFIPRGTLTSVSNHMNIITQLLMCNGWGSITSSLELDSLATQRQNFFFFPPMLCFKNNQKSCILIKSIDSWMAPSFSLYPEHGNSVPNNQGMELGTGSIPSPAWSWGRIRLWEGRWGWLLQGRSYPKI